MPSSRGLGMLWKAIDRVGIETREQNKAERAMRLNELIQSDVWKLDLYPILQSLHDTYLDRIKAKEMDSDTLKVFDDILVVIDGDIRIGAGAMERIAQRRLRAVEVKEKNEQTQTAS